jgi:ABC-type microcin C transport system permease subunit YejE
MVMGRIIEIFSGMVFLYLLVTTLPSVLVQTGAIDFLLGSISILAVIVVAVFLVWKKLVD